MKASGRAAERQELPTAVKKNHREMSLQGLFEQSTISRGGTYSPTATHSLLLRLLLFSLFISWASDV